MILQSLVEYYESLVKRGEIAEPGWSDVKVSYALDIDGEGKLKDIISLMQPDGKKLIPQTMTVPEQVKRSSGIKPNFLCENSSYFLGIDNKGKPERSEKCFKAAAEYHRRMLEKTSSPMAAALDCFFQKWDVKEAEQNKVIQKYLSEITKGGNIVFTFNGKYAHKDESIRNAWNNFHQTQTEGENITCMVTGKSDTLSMLHQSIKGVRDAQSSGASLVSFNAPAFCSYLKEQGGNAQTGKYAASAYVAALNHLIQKKEIEYIGDTAVFFYPLNGDSNYQYAFHSLMFGDETYYSLDELRQMLNKICRGETIRYQESLLDPDMKFCVLGIAPNAARLSVRFFYENSFGALVANIERHQERLKIASNKGKDSFVPIWRIMQETCREGGKQSPLLTGEIVRAIITDGKYPSTLLNAIDLRIRADHKINNVRVAVIKAYYIKNKSQQVPKEVLTMALNKEAKDTAYNLGRLFAVMEKIQKDASPGVNATIKDKFFGSASSIPATTFPNLINLSQKHLRKLKDGSKVFYGKLIGEITGKLEEFPRTLSMPQRGSFILGYYHQNQELYKGKEEVELKED